MTEIEQYEFDRQGYLVFEGMLNPSELVALAAAVDELEEHALARLDAPPRKVSAWGPSYHFNEERGYHGYDFAVTRCAQKPRKCGSEDEAEVPGHRHLSEARLAVCLVRHVHEIGVGDRNVPAR